MPIDLIIMDLYKDEILDHYKNPHNFGDLDEATATDEEHNPLCGDRIVLQLKMENGKLVNVKFRGEGCAISTAASSMLTDYIKGKSIRELRKLDGTKVLEIINLIDISPARIKCALLSFEALKKLLVRRSPKTTDIQ